MVRKHGACDTGTYGSWAAMKRRCMAINSSDYRRYGGRGITVCDRWKTFVNFLADMGERPLGKSLDRIDNTGNYEPGNCKWSTQKEQASNTRTSVHMTLNGETRTMKEWSRRIGLCYQTLQARYHSGWSDFKALTEPVYISGMVPSNRKLSETTVAEIRNLYNSGTRLCDLAERFGLDISHINHIVKFKIWKGTALVQKYKAQKGVTMFDLMLISVCVLAIACKYLK